MCASTSCTIHDGGVNSCKKIKQQLLVFHIYGQYFICNHDFKIWRFFNVIVSIEMDAIVSVPFKLDVRRVWKKYFHHSTIKWNTCNFLGLMIKGLAFSYLYNAFYTNSNVLLFLVERWTFLESGITVDVFFFNFY